jgi:hypothetical protein
LFAGGENGENRESTMSSYLYTIRVRFEALDDFEARMALKEIREKTLLPTGIVSEESLQEVYKDKAPRKMEL